MRHGLTTLTLIALTTAAAASTWGDFLVITTDYSTYGAAAAAERDAPWTVTPDVTTIGGDAVGRWRGGLYYVVDRGGDNLQILDGALATLGQFSVGVGRNPQDAAFDDAGSAYVPCYDTAEFLKVDPATGAVVQVWSTAAFADADGLPETGWLERVGGRLAITCQRLDRNNWWSPADVSTLLLFDPVVGDWIDLDPVAPGVQPLTLTGTNPTPRPRPVGDGRGLWVGTTGVFGVLDGGLEIADVVDGTTGGLTTTEAQLGGDLLCFTVTAPDRAFAIVSNASFQTNLVSFDPRDGSGVTTVAAAPGYDYVDVAFDGVDQIFLCDRGVGASGLRVFDAATGAEITDAPVSTGRPPFMVVLPQDGTTSVESVVTARPDLRLEAPFPNPSNPRCTVAFRLPAGATGRLSVIDLRGRELRAVVVTGDAAGRGAWTWDGLDATGRPAASGAYRLRLEGGGASAVRPFSLVR